MLRILSPFGGLLLLVAGASLAFGCGSTGDESGGSAGQGGTGGLGVGIAGEFGENGGAHAGSVGRAGSGGNGASAGSEAGAGGASESAGAGAPSDVGAAGTADAGAPSGGAVNGGAANGGSPSAGAPAGGSPSAGAPNGGATNGGAANGGAANGGAPAAIASVLTRSYDNQRSNANLLETKLNVTNVNAAQFGKLFDLPIDDQVYAQILYVPSLQIAAGTHNVIFVATVNNSVYAFDADAPGSPLWQRNFNGAGVPTSRVDVGQACGDYSDYSDYSGNIGIVATPVIDAASKTIYVASRTVEGGVTLPRLHAIDLLTGAERANSPVVIQASVTNLANQTVAFNALLQNQRMSLALSNGAIYMGFSAFCDSGAYHGWLLAYDAATLSPLGVFNDTPDGQQGGIWQAGAAPTFDSAGNLYAMTGNGSFDGVTNFGQTALKLAPKTLAVLDYFAPANYATLNNADFDLGSAGLTWLPGVNLLVGGGKEGKLYVLDPANLGHSAAGDVTALQAFQAVDPTARPGATHHIHNGAAAWQSPAGLNLYLAGENDYLRTFRFDTVAHEFSLPSAAVSNVLPPVGMPGGMLTVSANGSQAGSGIVWSTTPRQGDANQAVVPGILRAYNAETLALLWESTAPLDETLDFAKFSNPTVANGKVYAASFSQSLSVYGLRTAPPVNLALNKAATGSASCAVTEAWANAVNGSVILGNGDKWCSVANNPFLQVDLGANLSIGRVVVRHANAGGEQFAMNTRDFAVQTSTDGTLFTPVATITGNHASVTTHDFAPRSARYVRLNISVPTQTADPAARIYELEVYAL